MTDLYLVAGATGAGKTTYARRLAEDRRALRFSIDEWMTDLFWMDSPDPIDFNWTMERIGRCEQRIRSELASLVALGVPAVLDLGFTRRDHRAAFGRFGRQIGMMPRLIVLDLPAEVRWARVQQRNEERGVTWRMAVDRPMFDFIEQHWQAPDASEMAALDGEMAG